MNTGMPQVPAGSGKHPVLMVAISANKLTASGTFYSKLFGWQTLQVSPEIIGATTPAGPIVSLRANSPEGFPGVVPFIRVDDVDAALARVVAAGCRVEHAPWNVPMVGKLARFKDASGTIYGLGNATIQGEMVSMPAPFGENPKPPAGAICSLEMHAATGVAAATFFGEQFSWGTLETMPQYMSFDPRASIGGVFQSHTPSLTALPYIYADDVAAKLNEIDDAGGKRAAEPMSAAGMGTFGYFTDPSGSNMGLIGP